MTQAAQIAFGNDTDQRRRSGRPRSEEVTALNEKIFETAKRLFIERGFAGTTIERVAHESGTMRRSVNHRFPNKDVLLMAVAERVVSADIDMLVPIAANKEAPLDHLRMVCRNLLAHATNPDVAALFRVYTGEARRVPELSELLVRLNIDLERRIERIVLDIQEQGAFQRFSATAVSVSVIGMMISNPLNRLMMGDEQFVDPHRTELYFSQMWAIFLAMY